jgi:hypothetical protein
MNTKFRAFVTIASILPIAVYCSSINSVSALEVPATWTCTQMYSNPNYASCNLTVKGLSSTDYNCNYDHKTKKWTCDKAKTISGTPNQISGSEAVRKFTDSQIPLGLKSALVSAIKSQNGGLVSSQSRQAPNTQFGPP